MNDADYIEIDDSDDFNTYFQSESVDDWSCGHDETGHLVFDYDQFADQLRLDAY